MRDACVGTAGTKCSFYGYERHPRIIKGQMGGYIYAKIDQNTWLPIYIGQGDIGARCTQSHQIECIDSKGATHVHLKITADEHIRKSQEQDLLAAYPQAYAPTGCISKGKGRMFLSL